ncbi:transporter [Marilutibacter alkalisoli]|uniref:Transporter n=1 Tax=Marilutibacter alkalisoli TaxID=2591633 RepID=A0A514BSV1_9GAMM|nr:transporter [Lysobacter alkalisoli]QDH70437.1 transporter [Lysobacter alkalisoli]
MNSQRIYLPTCVALALGCASLVTRAQDTEALAKQLANPIASLTSVPMQLNYDDGIGALDDGDKFTLNLQPVIPVSIGEDWNMISRTILPIVSQHDIFPGAGTQFGLGDTTQSLFFSPKALTPSGWTWGVGPVLLIPTATDDLLGGEKWGAGPTGVALRQTATGWTYGALFNHIWSFTGDDDRADINATYLQPFLAKSLGKGRTVNVALESTYDWEGKQWTVPLNVGYSKVSRIGTQLVSYQGGVRYYIEAPDSGAEWGLRFTFTLLFPKK